MTIHSQVAKVTWDSVGTKKLSQSTANAARNMLDVRLVSDLASVTLPHSEGGASWQTASACNPLRMGQPRALHLSFPEPIGPGGPVPNRCSDLGHDCGSGELPELQNRGRPTTDLRLSVHVTGRSNGTGAAPRASQGQGGRHVGCSPTLRPLPRGFALPCWPSPGPQCPIGIPRRRGPQFGRRDQARIFGIDL
jgi:hypothetical protein